MKCYREKFKKRSVSSAFLGENFVGVVQPKKLEWYGKINVGTYDWRVLYV